MAEQDRLVFFLLQHAIERAEQGAAGVPQSVLENMALLAGDSCTLLENWQGVSPDVIYLDPMFEFARGSAAAKKELAFLQRLTSNDRLEQDNVALFERALAVARKRVVVKRTPGAKVLAGKSPSHVLESKAVRFDVYQLS